MNGVNTAPSSKQGMYIPPKNWDALSSDEKIERMREQIKYTQSGIYKIENFTRRLREILFGHRHLPDGKVVEEIKQYDHLGGEGQLAKAEISSSAGVYF